MKKQYETAQQYQILKSHKIEPYLYRSSRKFAEEHYARSIEKINKKVSKNLQLKQKKQKDHILLLVKKEESKYQFTLIQLYQNVNQKFNLGVDARRCQSRQGERSPTKSMIEKPIKPILTSRTLSNQNKNNIYIDLSSYKVIKKQDRIKKVQRAQRAQSQLLQRRKSEDAYKLADWDETDEEDLSVDNIQNEKYLQSVQEIKDIQNQQSALSHIYAVSDNKAYFKNLTNSKFLKQPILRSTKLWNALKFKYNTQRDIPHYKKIYTKKAKIPNDNHFKGDFYSLRFLKRKPVIKQSEYDAEFYKKKLKDHKIINRENTLTEKKICSYQIPFINTTTNEFLEFPIHQWPDNYKPIRKDAAIGLKQQGIPNYDESYTHPRFMKTKIQNTKKSQKKRHYRKKLRKYKTERTDRKFRYKEGKSKLDFKKRNPYPLQGDWKPYNVMILEKFQLFKKYHPNFYDKKLLNSEQKRKFTVEQYKNLRRDFRKALKQKKMKNIMK